MIGKAYFGDRGLGTRTLTGVDVTVNYRSEREGLRPRYDLLTAAERMDWPTFDWAGSESNRRLLAASILADYNSALCAQAYYVAFASEVLPTLDPVYWSLTGLEIQTWLDSQPEPVRTAEEPSTPDRLPPGVIALAALVYAAAVALVIVHSIPGGIR